MLSVQFDKEEHHLAARVCLLGECVDDISARRHRSRLTPIDLQMQPGGVLCAVCGIQGALDFVRQCTLKLVSSCYQIIS